MKDCFFTLGGGQFWEDLFVYNGWRIQRNLTSKHHRLLDNYDIIRDEGTFATCLQEWEKYKKAIDLPQRNNHLVICLHSYGQTRKIFNNLLTTLQNKNLSAESINYPSMQRNTLSQVKQLETLLNNMEDIQQISFITYGSGNILLEQLLNNDSKWKQRIKIGKAIEIFPWTEGNHLFTKLCNFKFAELLLGPMAKELNSNNFAKLHCRADIDIGVVAPKHAPNNLLYKLKLSPQIAYLETAKSFCRAKSVIKAQNTSIHVLQNKIIHEAIAKFIQTGEFV